MIPASKARDRLGWKPEIDFGTLVNEMVTEDLDLAQRDALMVRQGFKVYQSRE